MTCKRLLEHLDQVERLLERPPFALLTDVDGTISEVALTPQGARVVPLCRQALERLVGRVALVAAISGRPVVDLRNLVNVDGVVYVGAHGLERWVGRGVEVVPSAQEYRAYLRQAVEELGPLLEEEGLEVEDKGVAVALHFRRVHDPTATEQGLRRALETSPAARHLRLEPGKMVLELKPPLEVSKGSAVRELVREYEVRAGLYVGDDVTDLEAMRALRDLREAGRDFVGLAVGVLGNQETPGELEGACDYILEGVAAVCQFYAWLAERVGG